MYERVRDLYRRLRNIPLIGPLLEAIRYRRLPYFSTPAQRYAEQQALLEGQAHALQGIRRALARLEQELYKQSDYMGNKVDQQGQALAQRMEFQRTELFFEMRKLTGTLLAEGHTASKVDAMPAKVLNPDKIAMLQAEGKGLPINMGCGHKPMTGFVNVDARPLPGVDVAAQVNQLPFEKGALCRIHSEHLLEHFPLETLRRQLLPYWMGLLQSGGVFSAVVPDGEAMLAAHAAGTMDFDTLRKVLYGEQEYEGDFHFTMFSASSLKALFEEAGMQQVTVVAQGRKNGLCLECEVTGVKQ